MIVIKTELKEIPFSCEECPYSKPYGLVGERFCKVLCEYFTGNIEPPYKERPDECPLSSVDEKVISSACDECLCKEVCMYKDDLSACLDTIKKTKIPIDDAGSWLKLEATFFKVSIECPYMTKRKDLIWSWSEKH